MPIPISQNLQLAGQQEVTPWQLPFDELARGLKQKQNTQDAAIKDLEAQKELAAKLNSLPQDRVEAISLIDNIYEQSNALSTGVDLTTREGMTAVQMLKDGVRKEFSPGGKANAIETNLNTYNEWDKRQQEKLAKGTIKKEQYEFGSKFLMNNYSGVGEFNPITGMYNSFNTEEIADYVNVNDRLKELVKDTKANATNVTTDAISGDEKWIITTTDGLREVTEREIMEIAIQKLYRDDNTISYLSQNQKFGMIPEGSFYDSETGEYTPYMLEVIQDRNTKEFINREDYDNLTEQEKSNYIIEEYLNPAHYLASPIQAVASELGFRDTNFSQTFKGNPYAEMDYGYSLENMVTNYNFESPGMTVNSPGGATAASVDKFIDSSEKAAQSTLDRYLSSNPNTKNLEITPEQWLSGDLPEEISANFTPELIQEISYKLNSMALEKDAEEQRLLQAQKAAGIDELEESSSLLVEMVENLPDGELGVGGTEGTFTKEELLQGVGYTSHTQHMDLKPGEKGYFIENGMLKYVARRGEGWSSNIITVGKIPDDIAELNESTYKNLQEFKKRVDENLEANKTTVISHGMTTQLPVEEFLDPKVVVSAKKSLNSLLEEPSYFDNFRLALTPEDIASLTEFTGEDFSEFVESDGRIPGFVLKNYVTSAEGSGDYDNLAFSSQPLDGRRYVSKPFKLTIGKGVDAKSLDITPYFPIGDGQNGTIGNTEIGKVLQGRYAQAQEIILHPFQRSLESYTPPQAPNITIINTGSENSVKLQYTDSNTGDKQEINTTLSDATRIVADELYMHNKKIEYLSNKPLYNSIIQFANEKNISFAEAEASILKSKR